MPSISAILQVIIFLLLTETILRKDKRWNIAYDYLNIGFKSFVDWRANANIIDELHSIPKLFSKISIGAIVLMIFLFAIKTTNSYVTITLSSIFIFGIVVNFSFGWVFRHKEALADIKPLAIYMMFIGLGFVAFIIIYGKYPPELLEFYNNNRIGLPTQYEIAFYFLIAYIGIMIIYYLLIWGFALIIPVLILIILYSSSVVSRKVIKKTSKVGFIGLLGVIQVVILLTHS